MEHFKVIMVIATSLLMMKGSHSSDECNCVLDKYHNKYNGCVKVKEKVSCYGPLGWEDIRLGVDSDIFQCKCKDKPPKDIPRGD